MGNETDHLLELRHVKVYYPIRKGVISHKVGYVKAADDVSFFIRPHETLGLVGESGCGKSTIGRAIVHLEQPIAGHIWFDGKDLTDYREKQMRRIRPQIQMVFQDPYSSLNPRKTVENMLKEILHVHHVVPDEKIPDEIDRLLQLIGLPAGSKKRFPHEFSGGQRQRISIARALALRPKLVVCDEAVSALDVSVQSQILNLLKDLQEQMGLTYLFIAHGLGPVKYISDRVAVMYLGKLMEVASTEEIFRQPMHPYTKALLSAYPIPDPHKRAQKRIILSGVLPSPADPPAGCRFCTRCPYVRPVCREKEPQLAEMDAQHYVACHFAGK